MSNRAVITKEWVKNREYLVTALFEGHRLLEASCEEAQSPSLLGNVYIGKVKRILGSIGAAFVEIAPGEMTYLELPKSMKASMDLPPDKERLFDGILMAKQSRPGKLTEEDEIVVQVTKEGAKEKYPWSSTNISLKGSVLILTTRNKKLGISGKLGKAQRKRLHSLFAKKKGEEFGLIVRTNAQNASESQLFAEYDSLSATYREILTHYKSRTCHSCLYRAPLSFVESVKDYLPFQLEKIVTDVPWVQEELASAFSKEASAVRERIALYEDPKVSLSVLYGLRHKLEDALKERVRLKSGAFLVIQPTEALTVIDVNSGKCLKGGQEDFYLNVNLEAAEEIARQLRLRNISGICIVDFINMDTPGAERELAARVRQLLAKDAVPAELVGFTKLGLAEITRKKVKRPLWEQVAGQDGTVKRHRP